MALQLPMNRARPGWVARAALAIAAALAAYALRGPLLQAGGLVLGAAIICFLAVPLANLYEKRLSRPAASLLCLLTIGIAAASLGALLLPRMLREMADLAHALPRSIALLSRWAETAQGWLGERLPGIALPAFNWGTLDSALAGIASGAFGFAANLAELFGQASMAMVLAYFLLCDRDRIMLQMELLLPQRHRHTAVCMGNAVCRELRLYLRGQLTIAAAVSLLSSAALALVGVRSALVLGPVIGLLNMVPYFGPFIGGIPAVLIALGDSWQKAAMTVVALTVVQQLDGAWISPRIMGSLTGFSPGLVLIGIFTGARIAGVAGMLFALPIMMTSRTLFRIFVQKCENI